MNKSDRNIVVKFLAEYDKKLIESKDISKEQKEFLKVFIDECYEDFKKENE